MTLKHSLGDWAELKQMTRQIRIPFAMERHKLAIRKGLKEK
jgi:hypothetical protein